MAIFENLKKKVHERWAAQRAKMPDDQPLANEEVHDEEE